MAATSGSTARRPPISANAMAAAGVPESVRPRLVIKASTASGSPTYPSARAAENRTLDSLSSKAPIKDFTTLESSLPMTPGRGENRHSRLVSRISLVGSPMYPSASAAADRTFFSASARVLINEGIALGSRVTPSALRSHPTLVRVPRPECRHQSIDGSLVPDHGKGVSFLDVEGVLGVSEGVAEGVDSSGVADFS